jgi:hypothetical protein
MSITILRLPQANDSHAVAEAASTAEPLFIEGPHGGEIARQIAEEREGDSIDLYHRDVSQPFEFQVAINKRAVSTVILHDLQPDPHSLSSGYKVLMDSLSKSEPTTKIILVSDSEDGLELRDRLIRAPQTDLQTELQLLAPKELAGSLEAPPAEAKWVRQLLGEAPSAALRLAAHYGSPIPGADVTFDDLLYNKRDGTKLADGLIQGLDRPALLGRIAEIYEAFATAAESDEALFLDPIAHRRELYLGEQRVGLDPDRWRSKLGEFHEVATSVRQGDFQAAELPSYRVEAEMDHSELKKFFKRLDTMIGLLGQGVEDLSGLLSRYS